MNNSEELSKYRVNTSITIRVDILQQADQRADKEEISRSALFEMAIKYYLDNLDNLDNLESEEEN